MAWAVPEYKPSDVDSAGRLLAAGRLIESEEERALDILNNWRSSHAFPLNTLQVGLRQKATSVYAHSLVAQRLKRTPSIIYKLQRFNKMRLTRMQDIGGCRAVMQTVQQVHRLRDLHVASSMKHQLVNQRDYITEPKASGYRGIHLIYRYNSDRNDTYNGLLIEVQLRSAIQHAWATAVETVGTFLQYSLKSSEGPEKWLRFFSLTGSAFARVEGTPLVPNTPSTKDKLVPTIRAMIHELGVTQKLNAYRHALTTLGDPDLRKARYFLLELQPMADGSVELNVTGYSKAALPNATAAYLQAEKEAAAVQGAQVVLVAAESVASLKRAYPNYFLDTQRFAVQLRRALR